MSLHDRSLIKRPVLRETISREKTVLAIDDEDAGVAHILLSLVQKEVDQHAYLAIVVPEKRKNDAHDFDELLTIAALDRKAAFDGERKNVEYILERLGRPREDYKNVQRRIKEARQRFRDETLFLNGRPLGWPPQWPR